MNKKAGLIIAAPLRLGVFLALTFALSSCGSKNGPGAELQRPEQATVGAMCERLAACSATDARKKQSMEEEELARLAPKVASECALTYGAEAIPPPQLIAVGECTAELDCSAFTECLANLGTPPSTLANSAAADHRPRVTAQLPHYLSDKGELKLTRRARHRLTPSESTVVVEEEDDSLLVLLSEPGFRLALNVPINQFHWVTSKATKIESRDLDTRKQDSPRAAVALAAGMILDSLFSGETDKNNELDFVEYTSRELSLWGGLPVADSAKTFDPADSSKMNAVRGVPGLLRLPVSFLAEPGGQAFARFHATDLAVSPENTNPDAEPLHVTNLGARRGAYQYVSAPAFMSLEVATKIEVRGWVHQDHISKAHYSSASGRGGMRGRHSTCPLPGLIKGTRLHSIPEGSVAGVVFGDCVRFSVVGEYGHWVAALVSHQLGETILWYLRPNSFTAGRHLSGTDDELWTQVFKDGRRLWKEERFGEAIVVLERIFAARPDHDLTPY
ncbi:MAG: hypothetical protein GY811_10965, partial [Myxococcales bacterium]|nr:hypothetical protein [Myxococcales bacterium]